MARRSRARTLTERILTKLITDEIFKLVYRAQEQLGCEGCEEDWPSQWDHACLFFGKNPECRIDDFVPEYLEEAMELLDTGRVLSIFQAVTNLLGASSFIGDELDLDAEINITISNILNKWKLNQKDISLSFYSSSFNKTYELIDNVLDIV